MTSDHRMIPDPWLFVKIALELRKHGATEFSDGSARVVFGPLPLVIPEKVEALFDKLSDPPRKMSEEERIAAEEAEYVPG